MLTGRSHPPKDASTIPDAVATASGVVLALIIALAPGGDVVHKLLPGIIGPFAVLIRYIVALYAARHD